MSWARSGILFMITVIIVALAITAPQRAAGAGYRQAGTTPTSTAPPLPTAMPINFRVYSVRIQTDTKPNWSLQGPALTRLKTGQKVNLSIYVVSTSMLRNPALAYAWGIQQNNHLVAHHGVHVSLKNNLQNHYWDWWAHSFSKPGTYRFTGTATINGVRHHRSMTFRVAP